MDLRAALAEAVDTVGKHGDEFALVGGVAMAVHGVERFTKDVDLAITQGQVGRVLPDVADRDPHPLRIGGVSFATRYGVRVDLIDRRVDYEPLFREAIAVARSSGPLVSVGDRTLPVVTAPYLLAMKLLAARPQDEADIDALLRSVDVDYAAARDVVRGHLGPFAAEYFDRLARRAGRKDTPREYGPGDS